MGTGLKLGVNVDHVAGVRQARGTTYPDVIRAATLCESAGAQGITVHLREDRRHIQDRDVFALRDCLTARLNLEMANTPEILSIALEIGPDEVCIVPERREELTTEGGLDVAAQSGSLKQTVARLTDAGIMVSLFIEPDKAQLDAAREVAATYVELHTGTFCDLVDKDADIANGATRHELDKLIEAAQYGNEIGLNINAGHGLNLANVDGILKMPHLDTLNIGHSIVAHAIFVGIEQAVREMMDRIATYKPTRNE